MKTDTAFTDGYWTSDDGLKLHYRDYAGRRDRPPILCIPGLTRNARDFEPIADAYAGEWRVICVDLRGRGDSDYARDAASYNLDQYADDLGQLFDQAELGKVVVIGTSLGGIVAMLLAERQASRFAGVVLNDIGPVAQAEGVARISDYVGLGRSFPTWMHAARALREEAQDAYPDFDLSAWLNQAKRMMYVSPSGRISFDYDMKIAEELANRAADMTGGTKLDLWPAFRAMDGRPMLTLRGELSDVLSAATLQRMASELPGMEAVTVPRTGHTPTLEEAAAQAAIARLLAKVA